MDKFVDYFELTKPRLIFLALLSSMVGFYLGSPDHVNIELLFMTTLGLSFVSAGSMVLNQWLEREVDAKMTRTQDRPVASGRVSPLEAFIFGSILSGIGFAALLWKVHWGCALIAAITLISYVFIYTPLKKVTTLCTLVGAFPGALPPLAGWAAASWPLPSTAWVLFAILFLWQMPHFYAISWMWKDDYIRAQLKILSVNDETGSTVAKHMVFYAVILFPVALLPSLMGMTGIVYLIGSIVLGGLLVGAQIQALKNLQEKARMAFRSTIVYLTCVLLLMVIDKV